MAKLENFIIFYCVELARIGSSLKRKEVTQLANNLIDSNPSKKQRIIEWKKRHICKGKEEEKVKAFMDQKMVLQLHELS